MTHAGELREVLSVYSRAESTLPNGETDFTYSLLKTVRAKLIPTGGQQETLPGEAERMRVTHRAFIREKALPQIAPDTYFVCRGQRYDVRYYMPVYNQRGFLEIGCELVDELGGVPDGA